MILSKISQMFWCGALALAGCVPVSRAQENTSAESVPASETTSSDIDFDATLKAAEAGDAGAQLLLSYYYLAEESDLEKSVAWLTKAAEGGSPGAQYVLGERYLNGDGVEQSLPKAVEWWKKASDRGDPSGQFRYGTCLVLGVEGLVDADPERGITLISEAATAGEE